MKHFDKYIKHKSFIQLLIILSVFIVGFQILNSHYSYGDKESYLTLVDKNIYNAKSVDSKHGPFEADKIVRFIVPFYIKEYDLLDINKIAFISTDLKDNPYSNNAGIYDLVKGDLDSGLDQKCKSTESTIGISPDGKMILTSYSSKKEGPGKTYLYDIAMKKNVLTINNVVWVKWLPDSSEFAGVDEYIFVQDAKTGKRENLLKVSDYINKDRNIAQSLQVLKDGRTVCLAYSDKNGDSGIVSVDRTTGIPNQVKVVGGVYGVTAIGDKNIAILGTIDDKYGLYSYNLKSNSYLQLVDLGLQDQKIGDFCVTNDGKKIAYCVLNHGGTEIHAAALDNNKLINDEVVYRDSEYIEKLVWTKDGRMLYFLQQTADGTNIYRVLFNNTENTK